MIYLTIEDEFLSFFIFKFLIMEYETLRSNKGEIIEGILLIKPKILGWKGLFLESWNLQKFNNILNKEINFVQDNHSQSIKGVLRGLHFQINPYGQGN